MEKNKLRETLLLTLPLAFYYYLGPFRVISTISYIISLPYLYRIKYTFKHAILILICLTSLILSFSFYENGIGYLYSLRLFLGTFLLLPFLTSLTHTNIKNILKIIAISFASITILERIIITINPDIILYLPNYNFSGGIRTFNLEYLNNFLMGVHSFGANRTVSGTILLSLTIFMINYNKGINKTNIFILIATLLCGSSTTVLLLSILSIYYLFKSILVFLSNIDNYNFYKFSYIRFISYITIIFIFSLFIYLSRSADFSSLRNLTLTYVIFVFELKQYLINYYLEYTTLWGFMFGSNVMNSSIVDTSSSGAFTIFGDFFLLEMIARLGFTSFLIYLYAIIYSSKSKVFISILILFLGSIHYFVIFSGPGQLIFALLLTLAIKENKKKMEFRKKIIKLNTLN